MARPSVTVEGADTLQRTLAAARRDLDDLSAAHERTAELGADRARSKAPRRTGALVGSIAGASSREGAEIRAGSSTVDYAGYVEFGTRWTRAQPFLRSAAEETKGQWIPAYEAELGDILGRVKGD